MKKLIIGLGSGRCGTTSLTVALQKTFHHRDITHEFVPLIPWKDGDIEGKVNSLLCRVHPIVGDIAFYYLPYVEKILQLHPETYFICLQRWKHETVNSFNTFVENRNHWSLHDGTIWDRDFAYDQCFPKYNIDNKIKSIEKYYDDYYSEAQRLQNLYPNNFRIFYMRPTLNTEAGFKELLKFIKEDNKIDSSAIGIKKNQREKTEESLKVFYNNHSEYCSSEYWKAFDIFGVKLNSRSSVLDIGCGDGRAGFWLQSKSNCSYTGVDYSSIRIQKAVELANKTNASCNFVNQSAQEFLSECEKTYSLICLFEVLEHLENPQEVLIQCQRRSRSIIGSVPLNHKAFSHIQIFKSVEHLEFMFPGIQFLQDAENKQQVYFYWKK